MEYSCDGKVVLQYIHERIICIICHEITNIPYSCTTCTMIICKKCADAYPIYVVDNSQHYKMCPSCKTPTIFFPNSFLKFLIKYYEVICPDCSQKFSSSEYHNKHISVCPNRQMICDLCCQIFQRKDGHTCEFMTCNFCEIKIKRKNYLIHLNETCHLVPIKCKKCNDLITKNILEVHENNYCRKTELLCIYCKKHFYRIELDNHHLICEEFQLKCETCKEFYKRNSKHTCEFKICDKCYEVYHRNNEKKHINIDCGETLIECNFCRQKIKRKVMIDHLRVSHLIRF